MRSNLEAHVAPAPWASSSGCLTLRDRPCDVEAPCPFHPTWEAASHALRQTLASTSLAELGRMHDRFVVESDRVGLDAGCASARLPSRKNP